MQRGNAFSILGTFPDKFPPLDGLHIVYLLHLFAPSLIKDSYMFLEFVLQVGIKIQQYFDSL